MDIKKVKELLELSKLIDGDNSNKDKEEQSGDNFIGEYVIVRGYGAGVWAGTLINDTIGNIVLKNARMLWRWWAKGIGLSSIAKDGLDIENHKSDIKILDLQEKVIITDNRVSTFLKCSDICKKQILEFETPIQ